MVAVQPEADCVKTIQTAEEKLADKKRDLEKFQVNFSQITTQIRSLLILSHIKAVTHYCLVHLNFTPIPGRRTGEIQGQYGERTLDRMRQMFSFNKS